MNYKVIRYFVGELLQVEGLLMFLPLICAVCYKEWETLPAFLLSIGIVLIAGTLIRWKKPHNAVLSAKEGLLIVGASWILMSLFGCLPFLFSGLIPNPIDAFFETVSGFTTTGSTVLTSDRFDLCFTMHGVFFWRSFTHWIGGMGVLVFVLALIPQAEQKYSRMVYVMQAEMPGPKVDQMLTTVKRMAYAMYGIYILMTVVETVLLLFGGMTFYEAIVHAFATAGTGGFSIWGNSIAEMSMGTVTNFTSAEASYCEWVLTIFMLLFSINFNLYYLMFVGKALHIFFSEELRWFLLIVFGSVVIVTADVWLRTNLYTDIGTCIRDAAFQVASIISTTGFVSTDYAYWPDLSLMVILLLTFIGACAGSTGGGLKISRVIILVKGSFQRIRMVLRHREVKTLQLEKKSLARNAAGDAAAYLTVYILIHALSVFFVVLFDGYRLRTSCGDDSVLLTAFTAVSTCLNNVGPGLGKVVGPTGNFEAFSGVSKILLSINMLLGRLEIFPVLCFLSPSVWMDR